MLSQQDDVSWRNTKVLFIFGVIFLCGLAAGSVLTRAYLHSRIPLATPAQTLEAAQRFGLDRLKSTLELTQSQEQTITDVLDDYGKYYQNIEDQREDVAEHGKQRILDVLTEQQKERFRQIFHTH